MEQKFITMNRNVFLLLILGLFTLGCGSIGTEGTDTLPENDQQLLKDNHYTTFRSGQFYVHYPAGSYTAGNMDDFQAQLDQAKSNVLRAVGISAYDETIHFIIFEDQAAMSTYLGSKLWYYVKPDVHVAYIVHNENRAPYFTRTMFQLAAIDQWGFPKAEMLAFGGALFAKGICQDIDFFIDEVGARLARDGNVISYRALLRAFGPALEQSPVLAEIQAAALYQLIYDNFGLEKIQQAWQQGIGRLEGVIHMSPIEIEKEITDRWLNYTPTQDVDWQEIELEGC